MATYTWIGTTSDWSTSTNWSSSPSAPGTIPGSTDDVIISNAAPCTVTANNLCQNLTFTGYTSTFTISNGVTLSVYGTTITMSSSGMTFATGTTGVLSTAAGNQLTIAIAFNGVTIPNLTLGKSTFPQTQTVTISGSTPTVQNLTTSSGVATQVTLAGVNLIVTTSVSVLGTTSILGQPLTITGTCTFNTVGNIVGFNVTTGSTVVLANTLNIGGGTLTFAIGSFLSNPSNYFLFNNSSGTIFNTAPVTWYGFTQTVAGTTAITSNLNIGAGGINVGSIGTLIFNGAFNVNVSGSVVCVPVITLTSVTLNLTGSGNITTAGFSSGTVNISTGATYAITGATLALSTCTFNLVGTATCSVPVTHTLGLTSSTLTTNNTATGANIVGGSQIIWRNINVTFTNVLTYTTTILGSLAGLNNAVSALNTGKIFVAGNLSMVAGASFSGTSIIEVNGTGSISGSFTSAIIVNSPSNTITVGTTCSVNTFTLNAGTLNLANELGFNGGTLTIALGFLITGSSNLRITANTASITSNGIAWPTSVIMANTINSATTITLNDPLTITGSFTSSSTQANGVALNGSTLSINGNLTVTKAFGGTTNITILGTGTSTWSGNAVLGCNLTINKTGNFTISGQVQFGSSRTLTYTTVGGTFSTTGSTLLLFTCSVRSNGANWGNINGSSNVGNSTITLLDDMTCNSIAGVGSFGAIWNGFNMNINGDINIGSVGGFSGTTIFNILGTGNQSWAGGLVANPMKINKSTGTFTMSATCSYGNGTGTNPLFEHINGPVVTTGSTFFIGGNCQIKSNVLDPDAIIFNNLGFQNQAYTVTLIDNMTINSFTPNGGGSGGGQINGFTLFVKGDITIGALGTAFFFGGTTVFNISGTGNQTWNSTSTSTLRNTIIINKSSGTLNLTGTIYWGLSGNTLTYTQGTINPGTSTFVSRAGTIINLTSLGFSLYNWTPSTGTQTIYTQSLITSNSLNCTGNLIFTGSAGWICNNLINSAAGTTITLANSSSGATYRTTSTASLTATSASRITMTSNSATTRSIWTLDYGASQNLVYVNGTRIDSSLGQIIWTFDGVRTDTVNWATGSRPGTSAYTFVN
jgi:hypothetical protein